MQAQDQIYFQIVFKESGIDFRFRGDEQFFKKFCKKNVGTKGYIILCVGEVEKSWLQLKFFHGPVIDMFVRNTGDTDRPKWKKYLKENFLDRNKPDEIPSLADVSMRRMSRFIQKCVDHGIDMGCYLDAYEKRELDELTGD